MNKEECILRKAEVADIPGVMTIEKDSFGEDSFTRRQFAYLINHAKGWFYVIECESRIVGYISVLSNARTQYLRIYSIAIHPHYQGKGLGQMLLERAVEIAREHAMLKVTLEVKISNYSAIEFYKKNGFLIISVKENYYHDGTAALYMQLSFHRSTASLNRCII